MANKVLINRAPVLTLWAVVVAERLGYDHDAALTLGKAVAGLNAQAKGQRLGVFRESKGREQERAQEPRARREEKEALVDVLGRSVPAVDTEQGLRATVKGQPIDPQSVKRCLAGKFGDDLADVRAAMEALAKSDDPDALAAHAYAL